MGVLSKLKGRMTGRNALTKGPTKHHGPPHCDVDYMHTKYWDDMRKRNAPGPGKEYEFEMGKDYTKDFDITGQKSKNYTSGSDAVSQGLSAGANQPEVYYEDRSQEIAEIGSKLGEALAGKIAAGESNRKKELDQLQKDNSDMTRGEARKKRRANKKAEKIESKKDHSEKDRIISNENGTFRRSKDEHGVVTSFERIGPPPKNPSEYNLDTPSWEYNQRK